MSLFGQLGFVVALAYGNLSGFLLADVKLKQTLSEWREKQREKKWERERNKTDVNSNGVRFVSTRGYNAIVSALCQQQQPERALWYHYHCWEASKGWRQTRTNGNDETTTNTLLCVRCFLNPTWAQLVAVVAAATDWLSEKRFAVISSSSSSSNLKESLRVSDVCLSLLFLLHTHTTRWPKRWIICSLERRQQHQDSLRRRRKTAANNYSICSLKTTSNSSSSSSSVECALLPLVQCCCCCFWVQAKGIKRRGKSSLKLKIRSLHFILFAVCEPRA